MTPPSTATGFHFMISMQKPTIFSAKETVSIYRVILAATGWAWGSTFGIAWGNATGTMRWNHIFNPRLFSNTSLILSNYNYTISIRSGATDFDIFSQIRDWNLKEEMQWYINSRNHLRFGLNAIYHNITPGKVSASETSSVNSSELQNRYSLENAVFVTNTTKVSDRINLTYGLRLTAFSILGKGDYFAIDEDGVVTDTFSYKSGEV
jgi:outer membrane receptor for ferrienterochelin and colicin